MQNKLIFLSYRRDDSPGYVSKLETELEQVFGEGRVFRDAQDIAGGAKWKDAIDDSLRASAALLLVIGPRWEQIWNDRRADPVNYVALELERARELGIPVIPVTLEGVTLSQDIDLGSIAWLMENQFHDISDRQGRWRGDFARLVRLLESLDGLQRTPPPNDAAAAKTEAASSSGSKGLWVTILAVVTLAAIAYLGFGETETTNPEAAQTVTSDPVDSPPAARDAPQRDTPQAPPISRPATNPMAGTTAPTRNAPAAPQQDVPEVTGTWMGRDGTLYYVSRAADGSWAIDSPGYASGRAELAPNRPRLFYIEMFGVGRGEFSVSAGDDKMMGYIIVNGQQEFDTMTRVE